MRTRFNPRLMRLGIGLYAIWFVIALALTGIDQEETDFSAEDLFSDISLVKHGISAAAYQQLLYRNIWSDVPLVDRVAEVHDLRLVAVARTDGKSSVASVVDAEGRVHRLSVNDRIGDAKVVSIRPNDLVLQDTDGRYVLRLYGD